MTLAWDDLGSAQTLDSPRGIAAFDEKFSMRPKHSIETADSAFGVLGVIASRRLGKSS
jgi:hypothetical protein